MINWVDVGIRRADYAARVERVSREGWMWEASVPTGGIRRRGMATIFGLMRWRLGERLVRAGERLQGTRAGHIMDSATV